MAGAPAEAGQAWTRGVAFARKNARAKLNRTLTRKTALRGRVQDSVFAIIEETVDKMSRLNVYARLLVAKIAWQQEEFPNDTKFFNSVTANLMKGKHAETHPAVAQGLEGFPFQKVGRVPSKGDVTKIVASQIKTEFENNLKVPFTKRLRRYIRQVGGDHRACRAFFTGLGIATVEPPAARREVETLRCNMLGVPIIRDANQNLLTDIQGGIDIAHPVFLEKRETLKNIFKTYKYIVARSTRKFPLTPLGKHKRYHVRIEPSILIKLIMNNQSQKARASFCKDEENVQNTFRNSFRMPRSVKNTDRILAVVTDGVSMSVCLQRPLAQATLERIDAIDKSKSQAQINRERKEIVHASLEPQYGTTRLIGIDPGRASIVFGVERDRDGGFITHELSRAYLYSQYRKRLRRPSRIRDIWASLRETPRACGSPAAFDAYINNVARYDNELWQEMLKRRYARDRFDRFTRKQKVLDRFWALVEKRDPMPVNTPDGPKPRRPHLMFGGASFAPTGRGEKAVPVSRTLKRCKERFRVTMVPEYGTTRICSHCAWVAPFSVADPMAPAAPSNASDNDVTLAPVIQRRAETISPNGNVNEVRGVKHCCCPSHPSHKRQVHRDYNAAVNILHLGTLQLSAGHQRPALFTRWLQSGDPRGPYLRRPRRAIDTLTDDQAIQIVVNNHAFH